MLNEQSKNDLISLADAAVALGYPSTAAATVATRRGTFPVSSIKIPGRRGRFVRRGAVDDYLRNLNKNEFEGARYGS